MSTRPSSQHLSDAQRVHGPSLGPPVKPARAVGPLAPPPQSRSLTPRTRLTRSLHGQGTEAVPDAN